MSNDPRPLLAEVPVGDGQVLDLGGGAGALKKPLERKGYGYTKIDIQNRGAASLVLGDAQHLQLKDGAFALVVSNDSLEHFFHPHQVVREVHRVLADDGRFVIQVPFMQPFHSNDTYRYTPVGLRYMLSEIGGFEIVSFQASQWMFSIAGLILTGLFKRIGLGLFEARIRNVGRLLDTWILRRRDLLSFAAAYVVVARKAGRTESGRPSKDTP